jgi:hypothetical protein
MAVNNAPSAWISGWSEDATNVTFAIAQVPQMTAAEADGTTGDMRKVWYAMNHKMFATYNALAVGDVPARMTLRKSSSVNTTTGQTTVTFTTTFVCDEGSVDVIAE